jgi:HK97 family phage portal protein
MGLAQWFEKLLGNRTREDSTQNWILSPYVFTGSGYKADKDGWVYPTANIYASDAINNPIDRIATEVSKAKIRSIVEKESKITIQDDDISRLFAFHPNPLQTTSDFMNALVWMRAKYNNVFVYPQFQWVEDKLGQKHKRFEAFWILKPIDFEVGTDESGKVWEIKFILTTGEEYILPYADLIHLKWRRGTNLFKGGGDDFGFPEIEDVTKSVNALNATVEGLPKAIASSLQVKGVYNVKSLLERARMDEQRNNFEAHILDSKMGMVVTDLGGDFTPVNMQSPVIAEGLVKFMKSGITQRYGVSEAILSGDYTADQYDAFFKMCVEPFMNDFEQEMSEKCFTKREKEIGHKIRGYFNTLRYMSVNQKQEMAKIAFNTAMMDINGVLDMFGLDPIEGGDRRLQSLNYVNSNMVDQYQADRVGSTAKSEEPKDTTAMSTGEGGKNEN